MCRSDTECPHVHLKSPHAARRICPASLHLAAAFDTGMARAIAVTMRFGRTASPLPLVLLFACTEPLGPLSESGTFVLDHIGGSTLPASQWPIQPAYPVYVADTIQVPTRRPRTPDFLISWTHWFTNSSGSIVRFQGEYSARVRRDLLIIDPCPRGYGCPEIFGLITFQLHSDGLVELVSDTSPLLPRVYRRAAPLH